MKIFQYIIGENDKKSFYGFNGTIISYGVYLQFLFVGLLSFFTMKYRCLLIDHDDTVVDSTPHIHYPAHCEQLRRLGREHEILCLDEWFHTNYHPGIGSYFDTILKLNDAEKQLCYQVWREFTSKAHPPFFPGMLLFLQRFKDNGGIIVVSSHSEPDIIHGHYRKQKEVRGLEPDLIIGWEGSHETIKPNPQPVYKAMEMFNMHAHEILVVDDLKPGIIMAQRAGVDSVGVGWGYRIPELADDLKQLATYYLMTVEELAELVMNER